MTSVSVETQAEARIRLMLQNSPTFLIFLGGVSAEQVDARIHYHEVIENRPSDNKNGSGNSEPAPRPLAIIHSPQFGMRAAAIGQRNEYRTSGGIRLMLESKYLGASLVDGAAQFAAFRELTGKIRSELIELLDDPLGTASYIAFTAIDITTPPTRTPHKDRTATEDFFAVGWRLSLGGEAGD